MQNQRNIIEGLITGSAHQAAVTGNRRCPSCEGRQLNVLFNERLELDCCGYCGGIFFDRGELAGETAPATIKEAAADRPRISEVTAVESTIWSVLMFLSGN